MEAREEGACHRGLMPRLIFIAIILSQEVAASQSGSCGFLHVNGCSRRAVGARYEVIPRHQYHLIRSTREGDGDGASNKATKRGAATAAVGVKVLREQLSVAAKEGQAKQAIQGLAALSKNGGKVRGADFANVMRACLRGGQAEAVPRLYQEMKRVQVKPNQLCHLTLMKALLAIGRAKEALEVWYGISTSSLDGQRFSRKQALVAMAAAGAMGDVNQAALILTRLKKPCLRAARLYLSLCEGAGGGERAKKALAKMRSQGLKPDAQCLKLAASALCKSGQHASAVPLVMELSREPDEEAVSLMVEAYARGSRRDKLPALERRRRRSGVRLTVPAALSLSWLALHDDEDAARALAHLREGDAPRDEEERRALGEWCSTLVTSELVAEEGRVEAAWTALRHGASLTDEAGMTGMRAALKQRGQEADGVVAAVGAGWLERGGRVESSVLQRGVRGAAHHGMWAAGGRLLNELDRRGEDFEGDDVASAAVRVRSGLGDVSEAVLLLGSFEARGDEEARAVLDAIEQADVVEGVRYLEEVEGLVDAAMWEATARRVLARAEGQEGLDKAAKTLAGKLRARALSSSSSSSGPLATVMGLCQAGMLPQAVEAVTTMQDPTPECYAAVLSALAREGQDHPSLSPTAAVELVEHASASGVALPLESWRPLVLHRTSTPAHRLRTFVAARRAGWGGVDDGVWSGALEAAMEAGMDDGAVLTLARQMVKAGMVPTEDRVLAWMLRTAQSCGDRDLLALLATQLLEEAGHGDVARTRSRAAEAWARAGEVGRASQLVEEMLGQGVPADAEAYAALLSAWVEEEDAAEASRTLTEAVEADVALSGDAVLSALSLLKRLKAKEALGRAVEALRTAAGRAGEEEAKEEEEEEEGKKGGKRRTKKAGASASSSSAPVARLCVCVWGGEGNVEELGRAVKAVLQAGQVPGHSAFLPYFRSAVQAGRAKEAVSLLAKLKQAGMEVGPQHVKLYDAAVRQAAAGKAAAVVEKK